VVFFSKLMLVTDNNKKTCL